MLKVLFLCLVLSAEVSSADIRTQLQEKLPCSALGTKTALRQQIEIIELITGENTRTELQKLKFKHLSQFSLYLGEFQQLSLIRKTARGLILTGDEARIEMVQSISEFMEEEDFLSPKKVCTCAIQEGQRALMSRSGPSDMKMDTGDIRQWFAGCIKTQFVPKMYNKSVLENKYE